MPNPIVIAFFTSALMGASNLKNFEIQKEFEFKSHISWRNLSLMSFVFGGILGTSSYYEMIASNNSSNALFFTIIGAVVGYVAIQAFYTDFQLLKVDRYTLRLGYLIVLVLSTVYTVDQFVAYTQMYFVYMLLAIYFSMIVLFLFSGVGASDVRSIAIVLPFLFVVNATVGFVSFVLVLLYISIIMVFWQRKVGRDRNGKKQPVPILPYMFLPYMIIVPFYGDLINFYQLYYYTH